MRPIKICLLAVIALVMAIPALGISKPGASQAQVQESDEKARPSLVHRKRVFPKHYKRRTVRFTPWAKPTNKQVYRLVVMESQRWKVSSSRLINRISCESGGRWWASNGQYQGLGQFAYSTFTRGLSTMPRGVAFKVSRLVWRPTRIVKTYSNGKKRGKFGYKVKVRRTRIYRGRIPRWPAHTHGHAQVRIMAQAMAGRSAVNDSEWECR